MRQMLAVLAVLSTAIVSAQSDVMLFDFRDGQTHGWRGNYHVAKCEGTKEGLHAVSNGKEDPWIEGPAIPKLPAGDYDKIQIIIRCKASADSFELFYGDGFSPAREVRILNDKKNEWTVVSTIIPQQDGKCRLRIDPCSGNGEITVATISAKPLIATFNPSFEFGEAFKPADDDIVLAADKQIEIRHKRNQWDAFVVMVNGEIMATSHPKPQFACLIDGKPWVCDLSKAETTVSEGQSFQSMNVTAKFTDPGGAEWTAMRVFRRSGWANIDVETSFVSNMPREVLHVPFITLFPGVGSFGEHKSQALLAGVEYLVDEPSSDEKDVRGKDANRIMVDDYKLAFPLMAISTKKAWLSLTWNYKAFPATIFDSPDRQFKSGGHLFALWAPGMRNGRLENDFRIYEAMPVEAGKGVSLKMTLSGSPTMEDGSMTTPIADYIARHPLPGLPTFEDGFQGALSLAAQGWLDSAVHVGKEWRHAYNPRGFPEKRAYDAMLLMDYIADKTKDAQLAKRLRDCIAETLPTFPRGDYGSSVSHGYDNLFGFLYANYVENWLNVIEQSANGQLNGIRTDGSSKYVAPKPPALDYGSTHWTDHANGLTANRLLTACRYAMASGNPEYRQKFLTVVDKVLDLYNGDVPRGAQTWEIPLHTPDILGAAYMLDLCTTAYNLTGNQKYLIKAEYWALTGIPFIYLETPVPYIHKDGVYGTIAVLGSTAWIAPFWIGLPVQWCGLVYRNSLYRYANMLRTHYNSQTPNRHEMFWRKIADGITITGLQFSCQERDNDDPKKIGLLPDSFVLKSRGKGGPAINPGTVELYMPQAFGETPIVAKQMVKPGIIAHALGGIKKQSDNSVELDLWPSKETEVLVSGLEKKPEQVKWQGKPIDVKWVEKHRAFIVSLKGEGLLEW